jgi:WS/DGAT/MGAT family acyltransferase
MAPAFTERLTAEDAAFLRLEDEVSAMHNLTVGIFDGPEPDFTAFQDRVAERLSLVPRLRQRVINVPFNLERPVWVDDPQFSVDYHVRHTAVPKTGTLEKLISRLLSQRLDRGKPLWEIWMVSGLPDGQWAVVSKAHHAMIDGVSGSDPLGLVIDQAPRRRRRKSTWNPAPLPAENRLLAEAAADLAFDPAEQIRLARRMIRRPIKRSIQVLTGSATQRPGLVGAVGPHRVWSRADVDSRLVQDLRARFGVTTNDVILGLTSAGFRAMIIESGESLPSHVRTLVPLAIASGDRFTNEMSALSADLPVGQADVEAAMHEISDQTAVPAGRGKAVGGANLAAMKGLAAPTLCALGLRAATRAGVHLADIQSVVVNAPGPSHQMSLLGLPMRSIVPAIPLVARVRIGVGVMSYGDSFHFGVTGDLDAHLQVVALAEGIRNAAEALR